MAPLIVPGVCRFTVNGTYADRNVANIIDMHIDDGLAGPSRAEDIVDQAHIIVSAWVDHILGNISDRYRGLSVSWVDLSTEDGSTGEVTDGTGSDFPAFGGLAGQGMPGNVSWLVHKQLVAGRGSRAGRMYLAGVVESATDHDSPNVGMGSFVADINTGLDNFLDAINQDPGGYTSRMVVIHTKNTAPEGEDPEIELVGTSEVDALVCDVRLRTQRRRLG